MFVCMCRVSLIPLIISPIISVLFSIKEKEIQQKNRTVSNQTSHIIPKAEAVAKEGPDGYRASTVQQTGVWAEHKSQPGRDRGRAVL